MLPLRTSTLSLELFGCTLRVLLHSSRSMINDAVAIVIFEILNSDKIFGDPCNPVSQKDISLAPELRYDGG